MLQSNVLQGSADIAWDTPQGASGQLQGGEPTVGRARCHVAPMTIRRWDYPELCEQPVGLCKQSRGAVSASTTEGGARAGVGPYSAFSRAEQ